MPQLDFKEISQANLANGEQDTFEHLAREFLQLLGYKVLTDPDRGRDLGRDLIVLETRTGVGGETHINWLVSCKHKAHSGLSVVLNDEQDIFDRVHTHNCTGFIGFYSTLPASSLMQKLEGIKRSHPSFEFQIFDKEKIERSLLSSGLGQGIAQRYFPNSYSKWSVQNFDIDLALARIGMPQPVTYKLPNEDRIYTLEEVMKLYPQGNKWLFDPFSAPDFILCNNILGITKILKEGELVDLPIDFLEQRMERISREIEAIRRHSLEESKEMDRKIKKNRSRVSNKKNPI